MARVSFDGTNESTRVFSLVSSVEDKGPGPMPRNSTRFGDILDSIDEDPDDGWMASDLTCQDRVVKLLDSTPFQVVMASCIMLNAAVIGGETDYPDLPIWHPIETAFLVIFSLELLLRMFSSGVRSFFAPGEDQLWNLFDFAIVGLGIFDVVCEQLKSHHRGHHSHHGHHDGDTKNKEGGVSTLFRMIRLLRILRIFKIVRFLKQLYMLAFGFVEAIQAICWVTVLMFFVLYLCSIVMVREYGQAAKGQNEDIGAVLTEQFGTIKVSMLSLFELMSNPGNLLLYHVLMQDFPFLTMFLIAFVIFGSFGMIAMLTGIISESMFEKNQTRAQEERQEREQKRETLKQKCLELFASVEKDAAAECSPQDLEEVLPYVREMFEKLDLEYMEHDFDNIITMCDTDDNGMISEAEFVSGILSLCDGVRAASIQEVYYMLSQMNAKVKRMEVFQEDFLRVTRKAIPDLQSDMKKLMQQLSMQPRPPTTSGGSGASAQAGTSAPSFDFSFLADATQARLGEMKSSLASTMDEHARLLTRKIDVLTANVNELRTWPDPAAQAVSSSGDREMSVQNGHTGRANVASLPALPEWCSGDLQKNQKGLEAFLAEARIVPPSASTAKSITPLSPPPPASNSTSLLP